MKNVTIKDVAKAAGVSYSTAPGPLILIIPIPESVNPVAIAAIVSFSNIDSLSLPNIEKGVLHLSKHALSPMDL